MLTLLFFTADDGPIPAVDDLAAILETEPGMALDGDAEAPYRPGQWRDPATRAQAVVDCGSLPIAEDTLHPSRSYAGWAPVPLSIQLPLSGPHWCAVEALSMVERLMGRLPDLSVLDTEAEQATEDAGPGPLDRLATLANWEHLRLAHHAGLDDIPLLDRRASVALWRYRRERQRASSQADDTLVWPEALLLAAEATAQAHSTALWMDPELPWALPPVERVVIRRCQDDIGVLPADEVLTAAGNPIPDPAAGSSHIVPSAATRDLFRRAVLEPIDRYRFVDLYDVRD